MGSCLNYLVLLLSLNYIEGAFRCDYKYSLLAKGWFKHFVIPATWSEARLRCALEGATLASPTTLEIKYEMINILKDVNSINEIFTGIHATISQGDYQTLDGTPLSKIPVTWADNEPDNKGNSESCITFNINGEFADQSCDISRPYICHRYGDPQVTVNDCGFDPDYHLDARTNKCYKFHLTPRNFSRAAFACNAEGGHLAVVNSELESTVLKEIFGNIPKSKMTGMIESWKDAAIIGYLDWGERGEWRTIHGETLTEAGFDKFNTGEPSATAGEFCGSIWRNGLLNDMWCDKNFDFICERFSNEPGVCYVHDAALMKNSDHYG